MPSRGGGRGPRPDRMEGVARAWRWQRLPEQRPPRLPAERRPSWSHRRWGWPHGQRVFPRIASGKGARVAPVAVPGAMQDLLAWLQAAEAGPVGSGEAQRGPVALAAEFHARLVAIHPFVDGNGRATRLASNLLLMRHGYPPATWQPEDRPEYYRALEASLERRYDAITLLTAQAVTRTFDRYLAVLERAWRTGPPPSGPGLGRGSEREPGRGEGGRGLDPPGRWPGGRAPAPRAPPFATGGAATPGGRGILWPRGPLDLRVAGDPGGVCQRRRGPPSRRRRGPPG